MPTPAGMVVDGVCGPAHVDGHATCVASRVQSCRGSALHHSVLSCFHPRFHQVAMATGTVHRPRAATANRQSTKSGCTVHKTHTHTHTHLTRRVRRLAKTRKIRDDPKTIPTTVGGDDDGSSVLTATTAPRRATRLPLSSIPLRLVLKFSIPCYWSADPIAIGHAG